MGEWIDKVIKKHTCFYCGAKIDKKDIFTVKLDTGEGPHNLSVCKPCAETLNDILKQVEDTKNEI
jgi:hypothetical protein